MNVFLGYFLHKYCYDENNIWDLGNEVAVEEIIDVLQANRVALVASDIGSQLSLLLVKSSDQRLDVVPHPRRTCAFVCYLVNIDQIQAIKTAILCALSLCRNK